jgi:hypothetical protein
MSSPAQIDPFARQLHLCKFLAMTFHESRTFPGQANRGAGWRVIFLTGKASSEAGMSLIVNGLTIYVPGFRELSSVRPAACRDLTCRARFGHERSRNVTDCKRLKDLCSPPDWRLTWHYGAAVDATTVTSRRRRTKPECL